MFLLLDCDNFFVSCERAFQPKLKNRPVIVLSNNDGCVVARSNEAKALGIPMGCPYFKVSTLLQNAGGAVLSSNYELYSDMSRRVMGIIHDYFQNIEIYSIDEAFTETTQSSGLIDSALNIHKDILRQTGISVSIGIAPSKTLCKIAGEAAKKRTTDKVVFLKDTEQSRPFLEKLEVSDVWGIGRKVTPQLNFLGIFTAWELAQAPRRLIRSRFGISLERTVMELNGLPCLNLDNPEHQKTLICSRSFEKEISDFGQLQKIIAEFVDSGCLRLRRQNSLARGIITYISTNRFNSKQPFYQNSALVGLEEASCSTPRFLTAMLCGLKQIYRPGFLYKRAGITLIDIESQNGRQCGFFDNPEKQQKEQMLMRAFDNINSRLGRKSIYFGTSAPGINHYIRREFKSSAFTTSWNGLIKVN